MLKAMKATHATLAIALTLLGATTACAEKADLPYLKNLDCKTAMTKLEEAGFTKTTLVIQGAEDTPVSLSDFKHCTVAGQSPEDGKGVATTNEITVIAKPENILKDAFDKCGPNQYARLADGDKTLVLNGSGKTGSGMSVEKTGCYLDYLGAPQRVLTAMDSTRALDGRQQATWDGLTAEWTYHPDQGLDVLIYTD